MARKAVWLLVAMMLVACNSSATTARASRGLFAQLDAAIDPFANCDEVLSYLHTHGLERVTAWGLSTGAANFGDVFGTTAAATAGVAESSRADEVSTTNVQELGVDEADIVKTDGRLLLALAYQTLYVADVTGVPRLSGSIAIPDFNPQDLFLAGDQAYLLGYTFGVDAEARGIAADEPMWWSGTFALRQVDLSDPSHPEVVAAIDSEGILVASRLVGDSMRVVLNSQPQLDFINPNLILGQMPIAQQQNPRAWELAEAQALAANQALIRSSELGDWVAPIEVTGANGTASVERRCESFARPDEYSGLNLTSILSFDLGAAAQLEPVDEVTLVSDSSTVYASTDNVYLASQKWVDWGQIRPDQQEQVAGMTTTEIHRFQFEDDGSVAYRGSGEVAGWLHNQWSLSELDGYLRVASTTQSPFWGNLGASSYSQVSILAIGEDQLELTGSVAGLGVNEQIYAIRFIDDQAYVVTFRQIDPLYVIDLSDPTDPAVAGELKIPGYSAYLHPVGDGFLLGVGQDGDLDGRILGTQVALFDINDPSNPVQVDKLTIPGGSSGVEWDHRAFLYWPESQTAVIPMTSSRGDQWWQGSLAVSVGGAEVDLLAELEQSAYVLRNVVVGDRLLTVTDTGIQSYDLQTLSPETWVQFS